MNLNKITIFVFILIIQVNILSMLPGNLTWEQYQEKQEKERIDKIVLKKKIDYLVKQKKGLNIYTSYEIEEFVFDEDSNSLKLKSFKSDGYPLRQAMLLRDLNLIEFVLSSGADVNQLMGTGIILHKESVMHCAARQGFFDSMPLLIKFGASINIEDSNGNTPLHLASQGTEYNGLDTLEFLIKNGAKLNCLNKIGFTPLMLAAEYIWVRGKSKDKFDVIKLLLFNGANPNKVDFKGRDVIDCFKNYDDRVKFIKILRDYKKQIKNKLLENTSMSNDPANIVTDYLVYIRE